MAPDEKQPQRQGGDRIEWFTVSYRTLLLASLAIVLAGAAWFLLVRSTPPPPSPATTSIETGARFERIEGNVQVKRAGTLTQAWVADVAASFQATVVKMLVRKTVRAALRLGIKRIVLTGGVAANGALRAALGREATEHGITLHVPPGRLCTDNAAMIAAAGTARLHAGTRASLAMNAIPDLPLAV